MVEKQVFLLFWLRSHLCCVALGMFYHVSELQIVWSLEEKEKKRKKEKMSVDGYVGK